MTNQQHPITPPPELVEQWRKEPEYTDGNKLVTMVTMTTDRLMQLCEKSAQHGADQELEACVEWAVQNGYNTIPPRLRAARRPKPPSLKEQALEALGPEPLPETGPTGYTILNQGIIERHRLVRRVLEALPND